MQSLKSATCAGLLALSTTAPALAVYGEGKDNGPAYRWETNGSGLDKGGRASNGNRYGSTGQNGGNNGKATGWSSSWSSWIGGGNSNGDGWVGGGGGTGVSHSAPGPVMGIGLPGLAAYALYVWYRRRQRR